MGYPQPAEAGHERENPMFSRVVDNPPAKASAHHTGDWSIGAKCVTKPAI